MLALDGRSCDERDQVCSSYAGRCVCDSYRRWSCDESRTDLAVAKDLAEPPVGCSGYVECLSHCFDTTINASLPTCQTSCAPTVSGSAIVRYTAAVDCAETYCVGGGDGGAGKCQRADDGTLRNEDGTPLSPTDPGAGQKRCGLCLHDALAELYGEACTQTSSADCNPGTCGELVQECLEN